MDPTDYIFRVPTPCPGFPSVTLWQKNWDEHVVFHPEVLDKKKEIALALQQPKIVWKSATEPRVIFVSSTEQNEEGKPLLVCVHPVTPDEAKVITAYYGSVRYLKADSENMQIVWRTT